MSGFEGFFLNRVSSLFLVLGLMFSIFIHSPLTVEAAHKGKNIENKNVEKEMTQMTQDMKQLEHEMGRLNQKVDEMNWSLYQTSYSVMGLTHAMSHHCPDNLNRQELDAWRAYLKASKVSNAQINTLESLYQMEYQKSLNAKLVKEHSLICDSPKFAQYIVTSQKQIHFLKNETRKLSQK
jgi:hypothetical protein